MSPSQLQPMGQMYPTQAVPYMGGTGEVTSFLMAEARQHNSEIRLAVGKVADKVDQLASKVSSNMKGISLVLSGISFSLLIDPHVLTG